VPLVSHFTRIPSRMWIQSRAMLIALSVKRLFLRAVRYVLADRDPPQYFHHWWTVACWVLTEKLRIVSWNCISRSTDGGLTLLISATSIVFSLCNARNTATASIYDWSAKHCSMISSQFADLFTVDAPRLWSNLPLRPHYSKLTLLDFRRLLLFAEGVRH